MARFKAQSSGSLRVIAPIAILAAGGLLLLGNQPPTKTTTQAPAPSATILDNNYHGLPNPMTQAEATSETVKKLAERTGGDYDKLSYDEKMFMAGTAGSNAREALRNIADFQAKQKVKQKHAAAHKAHPKQAETARTTR